MYPANTPADFWAKTQDDGACVIFTGSRNRDGYGSISWAGRQVMAHRLAFFLRMGRWPDGILRHLCHRPECVLHAVACHAAYNKRKRDEARAAGEVAA